MVCYNKFIWTVLSSVLYSLQEAQWVVSLPTLAFDSWETTFPHIKSRHGQHTGSWDAPVPAQDVRGLTCSLFLWYFSALSFRDRVAPPPPSPTSIPFPPYYCMLLLSQAHIIPALILAYLSQLSTEQDTRTKWPLNQPVARRGLPSWGTQSVSLSDMIHSLSPWKPDPPHWFSFLETYKNRPT